MLGAKSTRQYLTTQKPHHQMLNQCHNIHYTVLGSALTWRQQLSTLAKKQSKPWDHVTYLHVPLNADASVILQLVPTTGGVLDVSSIFPAPQNALDTAHAIMDSVLAILATSALTAA